jgi:exonuclease SbcD
VGKFRFIHGADLHLDSPFKGLRSAAPALGQRLWRASFTAFANLVSLAIEEGVDFVLLAGDLFDEQDRSLQAQVLMRKELARLSRAGIETFIVHGNHDHWGGWRAQLDWPEGVHIFPPGEVGGRGVYREGRELARIYGISYPRAAVTDNYARLFRRDPAAPYAIALLHANVEGQSGHDNYAPCTLAELKQAGFDYWALGHIHTRRVLHPEHPVILYPGNTQGRSFRETGARGCYLVEVAEGRTSYRFCPTHDVAWLEETLSIADLSTEEELLTALQELVEEGTSRDPAGLAIVRLILTGRGPLHTSLQRRGYIEGLLEELRDATGAGSAGIWVDAIELATGAPWDLAALEGEESLVGDFLRLCREAGEDPELMQELALALDELYGHNRARRYLDAPGADQLRALLAEAREMGLDLLLGGGGDK